MKMAPAPVELMKSERTATTIISTTSRRASLVVWLHFTGQIWTSETEVFERSFIMNKQPVT